MDGGDLAPTGDLIMEKPREEPGKATEEEKRMASKQGLDKGKNGKGKAKRKRRMKKESVKGVSDGQKLISCFLSLRDDKGSRDDHEEHQNHD